MAQWEEARGAREALLGWTPCSSKPALWTSGPRGPTAPRIGPRIGKKTEQAKEAGFAFHPTRIQGNQYLQQTLSRRVARVLVGEVTCLQRRQFMKPVRYPVVGLGLGILLLSLVACVPSIQQTNPSFTFALNPTALTVPQGGQGTTTLFLAPQDGFTGMVSLLLRDAPAGVTLSPRSLVVGGGPLVLQTLTLSVGGSVAPGTYALRVRATAGSVVREADLTLTVTQASSFTIALNATSLTVQQGAQGTATLTLTPQGSFTGTVSLSLMGAPSGLTLSPTSLEVTGSGPVSQTLTLSVGSSVPPGTYALRVRATAGSVVREAEFTLAVRASAEDTPLPGAGEVWRVVSAPLHGVAYGGNLFVAVGGWGTILTSPDGRNWRRVDSGTENSLQAVAYGGGQFVAVGAQGIILTSP